MKLAWGMCWQIILPQLENTTTEIWYYSSTLCGNVEGLTKGWGIRKETVAYRSHVPNECDRTSILEGENTDTPGATPSLCSHHHSFERSWVWKWEKQCCPAEPSHYSGGGWKGCLKRRGSGGIQSCVGCVWEDPLGHFDTPFLHSQTLYDTSRTEAMQTGEEGWRRLNRGTFQTEEG